MSTSDAEHLHLAYVLEVLGVCAEAESTYVDTPVFWNRPADGRIVFYAMCSDMFFWAGADAEEITPADLPLWRRTMEDLRALPNWDGCGWLGELYACRKRQMRPMNAWFRACEKNNRLPVATRVLFEAAGPPRESTFHAP